MFVHHLFLLIQHVGFMIYIMCYFIKFVLKVCQKISHKSVREIWCWYIHIVNYCHAETRIFQDNCINTMNVDWSATMILNKQEESAQYILK